MSDVLQGEFMVIVVRSEAEGVSEILCARHSMRTWSTYATYQEAPGGRRRPACAPRPQGCLASRSREAGTEAKKVCNFWPAITELFTPGVDS